jgi:hypothetical protein
MIRDDPADVVLLVEDWLAMIEAAHAEATAPEVRAALAVEYEEALTIQARARRLAERQVVSARLESFVAAMAPAASKPVPTGPTSRAARAIERQREGETLIRRWELRNG